MWFVLFDPLLPPSSIPCIFTFTIPPSLPVGQSEERSDGSSSGSGAGAGPGESSVSPVSDKVAPLGIRHTECLLFLLINGVCSVTMCIGTQTVDTLSSCSAQFCPEASHGPLLFLSTIVQFIWSFYTSFAPSWLEDGNESLWSEWRLSRVLPARGVGCNASPVVTLCCQKELSDCLKC